MPFNMKISAIIFFHIVHYPISLFSYIGPGMGGGVLAALFGIIAAFFLGLWGILYYPIKRAFKNKAKKKSIAKNNNKNNKSK